MYSNAIWVPVSIYLQLNEIRSSRDLNWIDESHPCLLNSLNKIICLTALNSNCTSYTHL